MHKFEYKMDILGDYPIGDDDNFRKVYDLLINQEFTISSKKLKINPQQFSSWNAGIIGMHSTHFDCIKDVYELTDQFYASTRCHACEQYAFSYIIENKTKILGFENHNRHYWHKIEKKITDEILKELFDNSFKEMMLTEKLKIVQQLCKKLLVLYPKHPYTLRYNAMIAFSEKKYAKGYQYIFKTLLRNPFQPISFFKDVAYYTKKMILG